MNNLWIPIAMLSVLILCFLGLLTFWVVSWEAKKPWFELGGVGFRFHKLIPPPERWEFDFSNGDKFFSILKTELMNSEYYKKYQDSHLGLKLLNDFYNHLIVEIVPSGIELKTKYGFISESDKMPFKSSGTIALESEFPWSEKFYTAYVLKNDKYNSIQHSAIAHEIVQHLFPLWLEGTTDVNHSIKELKTITNYMNKVNLND